MSSVDRFKAQKAVRIRTAEGRSASSGAQSTAVAAPPRGPGRPSTGVRVDIRIPADDLAKIDAIAERSELTRAVVVRHLITERLNSWPYNEDAFIPVHLHA